MLIFIIANLTELNVTHFLQGEDVELVGDFTSNWKDKLKCNHQGGSRYEAEVRLRHGK
jgi:hypothetical protein